MWLQLQNSPWRGFRRPGDRALSAEFFHFRRHVLTLCIVLTLSAAAVRLGFYAKADALSIWTAWQGQTQEGPDFPETYLVKNNRHRAPILDAQGLVLASNLHVEILCHEPGQVTNPLATAHQLKAIIPEVNVANLAKRLAGNQEWLTHEVSPIQKQQIHDQNLEGIVYCRDQRRVYPYGRLFAHTIGYTGSDNQGWKHD